MDRIDTSIFKAYDIRGVYPNQLNGDVSYRIGRAYASFIKKKVTAKRLEIVVSSDARISSPVLKKALVRGLLESGVDVVDVGYSTTPTFYFSVAYYNFDGGIQVSASHNPPEYNGFKIVRKRAVPVSGETGIQEIRDMVVKNLFERSRRVGLLRKKDKILEDEIAVQSSGIDIGSIKPFRIVVDTGNGMGALDVQAISKIIPCSLTKLNFKLDGTFPVHVPDPLKEENLTMLRERVVDQKADLGVAVDGDGDRYFFVDEKGQTLRQEILRGIMAKIELEKNPGATVCYDIRPGRITRDLIEAAGGRGVVTKVGHSLIKETMLKENAIFGGESSGHYFYRFPYGTFEAPIVLVLKFLVFLSKQNQPLSKVIKPYQKYYHSGEINSEVKDAKTKLDELRKKYKDADSVSELDGLTFEYPDYWFNVRASNTEPLLRLNLEAKTKEIMEKKRDEVLEFIRS